MKRFFALFIFALLIISTTQPAFANDTTPTPTPQTLEIKPGLPGVKTIKLEQTTPEYNPKKSKRSEDEKIIPIDRVKPSITPDAQVEELSKKVASLEGKLAESEKKQSALEQTVNSLVSWIKTHFPFFK